MRRLSFVGVGATALSAASSSLGGVSAAFNSFIVNGGRNRAMESPAKRRGPMEAKVVGASMLLARKPTQPTAAKQQQALRYAHGDDEVDVSSVPDVEITAEEKEFFARTSELCSERNLPLEAVKNARDLASVRNSPVRPGRLYRTGRVSDASDEDIALLFEKLGVKTLVDLRSPTELKDDPTLEREAVFKDFVSVVWNERGRRGEGKLVELAPGTARIKTRVNEDGSPKKKKSRGEHVRELLDGIRIGARAATHNDSDDIILRAVELVDRTEVSLGAEVSLGDDDKEGGEEQDEVTEVGDDDGAGSISANDSSCGRRERHFVSIMNELKYVRGTFSKLRKRDVARALLRSPPAVVSKRARARVKDVFLSEINGGGLPLLNELLLRYGAPGIRRVLELASDRERHPVAFYCTAGKDRTGVIAAIILSALGVPDEDIVEDYSLSANVYAEMNDHKAMVGALSQRNLDAKTFLGAPPEVMRDTLEAIRTNYGSVKGYLDWIGFDDEKRERLRDALLLADDEEVGPAAGEP